MSICVCMHVCILFLLEVELWIFAFPYSLLIDLSPMIYAVIQAEVLKSFFSLSAYLLQTEGGTNDRKVGFALLSPTNAPLSLPSKIVACCFEQIELFQIIIF